MSAFLTLWLAGQVIAVVLVWLFALQVGRPAGETATPPVAIVVAVKGHDIEFDGFLEGIFGQDYPEFRVIFGVETAADEAVPAIEKYRKAYPGRVTLVVAGAGHNESQKITNVRACVPELTERDAILVFADADIWSQRDWLRRIVAPLLRGDADAISAYPWLIAYDHRFSTLLLMTISAGVATVPRHPLWDSAWGGVMGITHTRFKELGVAEAWRGAMSEDLQLTNRVQKGKGVLAPRELLMRTPIVTNGLAHIVDQARRWYMLVRVHAPFSYGLAFVVTTFNAAGWLAALYAAVSGQEGGVWLFLGAMGLAMLRTLARTVLVARLWGRAGLAENRWFLSLDWLVTPLAAVLNAALAWSALAMRRTTWSGTTYEVRGPQDVRIIGRAGRTH